MKRMTVAGFATALATAGALVAIGSPADAIPGNGNGNGHARGVASAPGAVTAAEKRAVLDYWTPQRMRNAVPRTLSEGGLDSGEVVVPAPETYASETPETYAAGGIPGKPGSNLPASAGTEWDDGSARSQGADAPFGVEATTGKLFFALSGKNYVCTASVADSVSGSVLSTAGHCLNGGGNKQGRAGTWATAFQFVPDYTDEEGDGIARHEAPYGVWVGEYAYTTSQWVTYGDLASDVGFLTLATDGAKYTLGNPEPTETVTGPIENVVGSQPLSFSDAGLAPGFTAYAFGYPVGSPYNGIDLITCWGETGTDTVGGTATYSLPCTMTGGSSGGPWFSMVDGAWAQVSVNSFGYGKTPTMYGPYFDRVAETAFEAADLCAGGGECVNSAA